MNLAPPTYWHLFHCENCHQSLGLVALGQYKMDPEKAECVGDDLGLVVRCRECGKRNTWHPVPSGVQWTGVE